MKIQIKLQGYRQLDGGACYVLHWETNSYGSGDFRVDAGARVLG